MLQHPVYTFLFDRRSLVLLLAGTAATAVLLFVGGLLVGLSLNLDDRTVAAVAGLQEWPPVSGRGGETAPADGTAAPPPAADAADEDAGAPPAADGAADPAADGDSGDDTGPPAGWVPFDEGDPWPGAALREPRPAEGVAPPPAPRTAAAVPAPPVDPEIAAFTVQVAAFAVEANARRMVDRLAARGWEPYVVELGSGRLLAVRFGRYPDADEARRAADSFRSAEGAEAIVVAAPATT